jgi:hypothetical protein
MKIKLYRIQDSEGRGPYRPGGFAELWLDPGEQGMSRQPPGPWQFGREPYTRASGHAFRSVEQLCRWFSPSERRRLAGLGFNVVSFMADGIVIESEEQVLFARRLPMTKGAFILPWPEQVAA